MEQGCAATKGILRTHVHSITRDIISALLNRRWGRLRALVARFYLPAITFFARPNQLGSLTDAVGQLPHELPE